ncbi:hypothetical protein [Polaromonas sp.]|uniref:hypothetical protein n=1 Tax=Polaromonas sp. TaxID=1869339 RepID=UPI003750369A
MTSLLGMRRFGAVAENGVAYPVAGDARRLYKQVPATMPQPQNAMAGPIKQFL